MNDHLFPAVLGKLTFGEAVWLFPAAFTLHVLEEWPRFTAWANRYASQGYTRHEYVMIHLAGILASVVSAALMWRFPYRALVFVFFALVFTPSVFWNAIFHAGATVVFRVYCPGVMTAVGVYPVLFYVVSRGAYREGLLSSGGWVAALVIAGVFHAWEVGHNVFKVW